MTPRFARPLTDGDVDELLLKAAASGRISPRDLDALIAYVISLRTDGIRPGLIIRAHTN